MPVPTVTLYDTLSKTLKPLKAADGKRFRFYCCGPTVYGPAHIGNFRTFTLQDVFRRVLELVGLNPLHARNITDVDDKTIRQSLAENKTLKAFTDYWRERFEADCATLGLLQPHIEPSAVAHIPEQIAIIEALLEKKHAYVGQDGVYFDVSSFKGYGALAHLNLEDLETQATTSSGALNQADEYARESVTDFALWKAHKPEDGANSWDSPWGKGRPGWHIECSAMCQAHLGQTIDLHGGGIDLIFPHHVNEIAQSEGASGQPFCQHWFHVAHLKVEGAKMSKSLGNLYTLKDLEEKGFPARIVRYLLISGHYHQPLNFTFEGLHAAQKALERLDGLIERLLAFAKKNWTDWTNWVSQPTLIAGPFDGAWQALLKDLGTPQALGELFSEARVFEKGDINPTVAEAALKSLAVIMYALGLSIEKMPEKTIEAIPENIQAMAESRHQAKLAKDFAKADALRAKILGTGWLIVDAPTGYTIERIEHTR